MKCFSRDEIEKDVLPGRAIQRAIGNKSFSCSQIMTLGFAHYSAEAGPMEPHKHAEEAIYVIDAKDGWVEYGPQRDALDTKVALTSGMVLHVPEGEWHVFRYASGGFVDIVFIYAQVI
jgi:mannose-6-phosphate isomerase-like protein (cupin superfamily)